jgi:dienelactone hydrolase
VTRVVLFHSVQGLRPGVEEWAGRLREAGHEVWTPDLLEGRTFDDLEAGVAHRDELGVPELMRRAEAALVDLPADLVYAGFSMGAATAGYHAATRAGARGAILMHGVPPLRAYGVEAWPEGLPAQVHFADGDPWVEGEEVVEFELLTDAAGAPLEVHAYPGEGHLFADPGSPDFDAAAAELMLARVLELLGRLG